jgi:hypothetical protein
VQRRFTNNQATNAMLTRQYQAPFTLPAVNG